MGEDKLPLWIGSMSFLDVNLRFFIIRIKLSSQLKHFHVHRLVMRLFRFDRHPRDVPHVNLLHPRRKPDKQIRLTPRYAVMWCWICLWLLLLPLCALQCHSYQTWLWLLSYLGPCGSTWSGHYYFPFQVRKGLLLCLYRNLGWWKWIPAFK